MNLKIETGTVGHNNKILISDGNFSLGKNEKVNAPAMKSHKYSKTNSLGLAHAPNIFHKNRNLWCLTTRRKLLWYWLWEVVLQYGICFDESQSSLQGLPEKMFLYGSPAEVNKLHS